MTAETARTATQRDIRDLLLDAANLSIDQLPLLPVIFDRVGTQSGRAPARPVVRRCRTSRLNSLTSGPRRRHPRCLRNARRRRHVPCARLGQRASSSASTAISCSRPIEMLLRRRRLRAAGWRMCATCPISKCRLRTSLFEQVGAGAAGRLRGGLRRALPPRAHRDAHGFRRRRPPLPPGGRRPLHPAGHQPRRRDVRRHPAGGLSPIRQALSRVVPKEIHAARSGVGAQDQRGGRADRGHHSRRCWKRATTAWRSRQPQGRPGAEAARQRTRSRIKVESSEQPLFWAYLGQNEGCYTLCIDEPIDPGARIHQRCAGALSHDLGAVAVRRRRPPARLRSVRNVAGSRAECPLATGSRKERRWRKASCHRQNRPTTRCLRVPLARRPHRGRRSPGGTPESRRDPAHPGRRAGRARHRAACRSPT